ncbi:hypothetical protein ACHAXR_008042 [Thalassiosira sp. AJA248-18]
MAEEADASNSEYGRPRRPSPATVTYLSGLPLDENLAAQQAREYIEYFSVVGNKDGEAERQGEPPEYPQMLSAAHAALSSIFRELASLACEEIPSQQIETLVRIACRYSLVAKRIILASMSTYWTFLSTHRFGSHVAQTVLRCVVAECEMNLDEFDDGEEQCEGKMVIEDSYGSILQNEDGNHNDSLSKILVKTMEELKPFASDLAVHVCGSHVLRTAIMIMAGAELVDAFPRPTFDSYNNPMSGEWDTGVLGATRRGKLKDKKKKKKKRGGPTDEDRGGSTPQVATVVKEMKVVQELQSADFKKDTDTLLNEIVGILSLSEGMDDGKVNPPGELQQLTCHPSAGPLLVQILRLLSFRDFHSKPTPKKKGGGKEVVPDRRLGILPQEPRYSQGSQAESFVHRLLCWDPSVDTDSTEGNSEGVETSTKQPYAGDIIFGLSGEPRGSILLEAIFHCCPDSFHDALCTAGGFYDDAALREYIKHGVSNFVVQTLLVSVRNREQVSRMVKCFCGIIEDGSVLKRNPRPVNDKDDGAKEYKPKSNNQRMGIVWRTFEMCGTKGSSQDQEQILSALMRGFASTTTAPEDDSADGKASEDKKRKKRSKAKGLSVEECIPSLLGFSPGSYEGESDFSRLTLDAAGARTLFHVLHFKERLRKDWVNGIVNVYGCDDLVKIANDGLGSRCIMDGLLDGPARSFVSKLLVSKLSDRITFLAAERVGHHTVEKLFRALPTMEDKAALSAELSHSLNRLGSNAMGRSVMVSCAVKEYLEGERVWKEALAKQKEKDGWLEEILGEKEGSDDEEGDEPKTKKRKKDKKEKKKKRKSRGSE